VDFDFRRESDAERLFNTSEPVNLGAAIEITIKDLAELIAKAVGFDGEIVWDTDKPGGKPRRKSSTDRAAELFGFEAEVLFREGILRTVEWLLENREWVDSDI
jgi:GDP-L-fucose synthase